jgi:hypothetical protein
MTAYTEFVKEWAKRNGVSYMCAIGKPGLKTEYNNSKNIVNKKGRAVQAVNSYNEQGGFRPREKRTRKPKEKAPELKRRNTIELENPIQLGLASVLAKKQNAEQIKRKKKRLVIEDKPIVRIIPQSPRKGVRMKFQKPLRISNLPPNWIQQRSGDGTGERTVFFNTMTGRSQFEIPS